MHAAPPQNRLPGAEGVSRRLVPLLQAADLFPPTAGFGAAVWGEIPRLPRPILQFALLPASSHAGLSSPPVPAGPCPLPGDRSVQGGIRARFWHGETQRSPIPAQGAPGTCPPRPSSLLPPADPPSRRARSVELCQHTFEGDAGAKSQAQPPLANCSQQRGCEQSPVLHPRDTSAARQKPGMEVLTPAVVNCPPGLCRSARGRDPCPVNCTTRARPCWSGQGAAGGTCSGEKCKDQGVDRMIPSPKPFSRLWQPEQCPGVQPYLHARRPCRTP